MNDTKTIELLRKALIDIAEWVDKYCAPNHPISVIAKQAIEKANSN